MKFLLLLFLLLPFFCRCQINDDLDNRINGLTTIVESRLNGNTESGTGFFYYLFKDTLTEHKATAITSVCLITNRHIIFQKDKNGMEHMPDSFTFYLRNFDDLTWKPITIQKSALKNIVGVFKDKDIDIASVYINQYLPGGKTIDSNTIKYFNGVFDQLMPNKASPTPQVADDIIVIGYPNGFYDQTNLYPIVKTGIIASKWGAKFNGKHYFLIDSKLFPGSSGSLVISKPSNFAIIDNQMMSSTKKQFVFLGIYSGEPYSMVVDGSDKAKSHKETYDVGVVWYGYLIKKLMAEGILWREPVQALH